jgi:hypothetical protein
LDDEKLLFSLNALLSLLTKQEANHSNTDGTSNLPVQPFAFVVAGIVECGNMQVMKI